MKKLSEIYKELGIAFTFPISIKDADGRETYWEDSSGLACLLKYDEEGRKTYFENRTGFWRLWEYDEKGEEAYFEDSEGRKRGTKRGDPLATKRWNCLEPALATGPMQTENVDHCAELLDRVTRAEIILDRLSTGYWTYMLNLHGPGEAIGDQVLDYWRKYVTPNAEAAQAKRNHEC